MNGYLYSSSVQNFWGAGTISQHIEESTRNKICGLTMDSGNPQWEVLARLNCDLKVVVACLHKFRVILVPEP